MRALAAAAAAAPARRPRSSPLAARRGRAVCAAAAGEDKVVHLVRHGQTEMNVALGLLPKGARYGEPRFRDPGLPDTRLTAEGHAQAAAAAAAARRLAPPPELVVSSPLSRALHTAQIMFGDHSAPRLVQPLAAERLYLSSDVGRLREQLEADFCPAAFDFRCVPYGEPWWHDEAAGADPHLEAAAGAESLDLIDAREPPGAFLRRAERLRQWLAARPERNVALVSHWGLLHALTGLEFDNCEIRTVRLSQLRARPHLVRQPLEPAA